MTAAVQFEGWTDPATATRFRSYREREALTARIGTLLGRFSSVPRDSIALWTDRLLANTPTRCSSSEVESAQRLAEGLIALGAKCVVLENADAGLCETCNTYTVLHLHDETPDIHVFLCTQCAEVKRSCSYCGGQGWLRHFHAESPPDDWYVCDECCTTWVPDTSRHPLHWQQCDQIRQGKPELLVRDCI
jgi:hypothetical protein